MSVLPALPYPPTYSETRDKDPHLESDVEALNILTCLGSVEDGAVAQCSVEPKCDVLAAARKQVSCLIGILAKLDAAARDLKYRGTDLPLHDRCPHENKTDQIFQGMEVHQQHATCVGHDGEIIQDCGGLPLERGIGAAMCPVHELHVERGIGAAMCPVHELHVDVLYEKGLIRPLSHPVLLLEFELNNPPQENRMKQVKVCI
jgi:hypothetical protein